MVMKIIVKKKRNQEITLAAMKGINKTFYNEGTKLSTQYFI